MSPPPSDDNDHRNKKRPNRGRPAKTSANASETPRRGARPTAARLIAVRVVERVQRVRAFADLALRSTLAHSGLSPADRALATELVYGTLRWRGRVDFVLTQVLDRKLDSLQPMVASILRVGAYQILFSDRIPDSAAVDESVRCARASGAERATGLVNAVLRRVAREHAEIRFPSLEDDPTGHLVHALSLPEWIARAWLERFGPEEAAELARASNAVPPRTIRANRVRNSRDELLVELRERFPDARASTLAPDGIILAGEGGQPARDPAFLEGRFTVQDESSQLVVELLDPQPGDKVLDACAAPGTKATAIAERLAGDGFVLATDRHEGRLQLVARDARRLGVGIGLSERDATESLEDLGPALGLPEGEPARFDRILVDAPCSGLGTLRRNPDARWRLRPSDIDSLAEVQRALLDSAAAVLRPGGTLVYSTCTVVPEENERIIASFLQRTPGFRHVPKAELPATLHPVLEDDGTLRCLPHRQEGDGFYAVRLERMT